jgi:hypothetical protein
MWLELEPTGANSRQKFFKKIFVGTATFFWMKRLIECHGYTGNCVKIVHEC